MVSTPLRPQALLDGLDANISAIANKLSVFSFPTLFIFAARLLLTALEANRDDMIESFTIQKTMARY
jgi:hypothetical protein